MSVAGTYECVTQTPMGAQKGRLVVQPDGADGFTGSISGDLGTMDIAGGRVTGDTLAWRMKMSFPMPIDLDCSATVTGDVLKGEIKAGMFGTMALNGTRVG